VFEYDISKGQYPINTLRTTALKGSFYDIEAIYIKQTNVLSEMNSSIWFWWKDFLVGNKTTLGKTYGDTVKRYKLVDKLLKGLEENPFGRRHKISLWQEQQAIDDPKALEPCAGLTLWSVREYDKFEVHKRFIDLTLIQRSMDLAVTSSINPVQYVEFAMMVCNHLTFKTGIRHEVGKLLHLVQNCHIYVRHLDSTKEVLKRKPTKLQPTIELICEPKDFYEHTVEDFKFSNLEGIEPLTEKLEIAI
jgi:thymidylate synthase